MTDEQQPGEALHFGPYRVQVSDVVGKGGMGIVYRGVHEGTGDVVAIKVVHKVSANRLAAIRREIHALRRVRHPGIVRIFEDGVSGGLPWVAMELLQGRTLREHLEALRPKPTRSGSTVVETTRAAGPASEPPGISIAPAPSASACPLVPVLTLIRRLCAPLAFLHGESLVHRDLKPENIFLLGDGRPVLFDLGITVHFGGAGGREELDVEQPIGTPEYMAPEQILGELVDARADLYALGCILYECVTGQRPFSGSAEALAEQHLYIRPLRPSHCVPSLPPALDELILKLLEKDAYARIGYAVDVAAKLAAMGAEMPSDDGPPARPYLYRPALAGRAEDFAKLKTAVVRAADQRRGGLSLVRGESGVGKTRLVKEVARIAAQQKLRVLTGCCLAPGAGAAGTTAAVASPLHPLRPVLIEAADRARGSRTEADRLVGPRGRVLSTYEQALLGLPGQEEQPALPDLPPKKARERVIAAMRETLFALAKPSPLLLVLDDLQWADDLTLSVLASLPRAGLDEHGILIVATYRSEETRPEIESLARASGVTPISLKRLDIPNIAAMVEGMLAGSASRAVLNQLVRHSNGNPFFVAEYLRAALGEGILRRDESSHFCFDARGAEELSSLAQPHTLSELIERRLVRLSPGEQALTAWAAVLGQELDDELLLSGAPSEAAGTEALQALRARQILEEAGKGQLRFAHDKIRETAYKRIDAATRVSLHRRAGKALESRHARAIDKAAELGHHFERAGLHKKACWYFTRAARRAQEVYANGDAIRFYQAAIDARRCAPRAATKIEKIEELHESLGDVLGLIGHQEEARSAYRAALTTAHAPPHLVPAQLLRKIGKTWEMQHRHAEALEHYFQAETALDERSALPSETPRDERAMAPRPGAPATWWHEWIQIQLDRISVHYWKADIESLRERVQAIRSSVKQRGTLLHQAHYLHALTQQSIQMDRFVAYAETVGYARACVEAYEAAGEASAGHWVVAARCSLAFVLMLHGSVRGVSLRQAEEEMDAALHAAERTGDLEVQTRCLTYLTVIHRRQRRLGPAEKLARRSLSLARTEQVSEYVGAALGNLAWIALSRGNYAEAERAGREALSCWEPLALVYPFQWLARLPLCCVELMQHHRLEGAIEQARAVLDRRQQRLPERLEEKLDKAVTAFAEGHETRAKRMLLEALQAAESLGYA